MELCHFSSSSYPPGLSSPLVSSSSTPFPSSHERLKYASLPMSAACFIAHRSDCTARRPRDIASASLPEVCPLPILLMPAEARCEAEVSRCAAVRRTSPVFHLSRVSFPNAPKSNRPETRLTTPSKRQSNELEILHRLCQRDCPHLAEGGDLPCSADPASQASRLDELRR